MASERPPVHLLSFELSARRLALPAELLETVVRATAVSPLPDAPPFIDGVVNLRGRVLPVVDLRRRFGLPPVPLSPDQRFIVVRGPRRACVLRVDEVHELIAVTADAIEQSATVLPGAKHALGFVRLPDGVLVLQDPEALLSSEDDFQLEAALVRERAASREPVA